MTTAVAVREKPILFSGEMVRAILEGRKTQTRRAMKPQPPEWAGKLDSVVDPWAEFHGAHPKGTCFHDECAHIEGQSKISYACPYGVPGDRLWVRETWRVPGDCGIEKVSTSTCRGPKDVEFRADFSGDYLEVREWRPSIFMPRWASRITLEITEVRVQRVQEISHEDAIAEGCYEVPGKTWGRLGFQQLWESINLKRGFGWDSNPFVWCVSFKRLP